MKTRLYLLLPAFALAYFASAQTKIFLPWEFAGGPPCPVRDMVLHQGTLYAATDCGLYKRPESGGSWVQQLGTPTSAFLFVTANAGAVVAVGSQDTLGWIYGHSILHVYTSTDDGNTFVHRHRVEYNFWSVSPGPHPTNHTTYSHLYALGDSSFALTARSCDYGCRYTRMVSTDNGQHWFTQFMPSDLNYYSILNPYALQGDSLAIYNFDSLRLVSLASLQLLSVVKIPPNINKSQAAGLTWVNDRLTITFRNGRYAYTDDFGQNWTVDSLPLAGISTFFYSENYYYWCTNSGFYRSATIPLTGWETLYTRAGPLGVISQAQRGLNGWYLLANAVLLWLPDGANDALPVPATGLPPATGTLSCLADRLMFVNADSLWWQSPDGEAWSVYENETAYTKRFVQYYAGDTFDLAVSTQTGSLGIYRSVDKGVSWTFSPSPVAVDNYYGRHFGKNRLDSRVYFGPHFTSDGGLTWQTVSGYAPTAALGDTLLTIPGESGGKISFDHGQNWQDLMVPVPSGPYTFHLADHVLFAFPNYYDAIYRSTDFGTTWEVIAMDILDGPVKSERIGQTTWLQSKNVLAFIPDPGQGYFVVNNTPFSGIVFIYPSQFPHLDFGRIVQKDSTVYAALNGGIWRLPACYAEHPFPTPLNDTTICQGNFLLFHGDTLRTAGTYIRKIPGLTTVCDSLDVLRLQVNLIQTSWYKKICIGDTLLWNGIPYSGYNSFVQQFSTPTSCDSTVTLHLSNYYPNGWSSAPLCADDTLQLHGQTITTPGQYTFHLTSFAGCDSTLTVNVYDAQDTFNFSSTICAGATYALFGHAYTMTGEYWFTRIVPTNPCPSIYHIQLTVQPDVAITVDTSVTIGSLLYGQVISGDTIFTVVIPGPGSCDQILTVVVHTTVGTIYQGAQQAVQVFPNPFRDQLHLRWPGNESAHLRLYDARGQLCQEAWLTGPTARWETEALPAGLYRFEIQLNGVRYVWKVIKI